MDVECIELWGNKLDLTFLEKGSCFVNVFNFVKIQNLRYLMTYPQL